MPRLTRDEKKAKRERIRYLMVLGYNDDEICADAQIKKGLTGKVLNKRTLRSYKKKIRETAVPEFGRNQALDLWIEHVDRLRDLVKRCYAEIIAPGQAERELGKAKGTRTGESQTTYFRMIKDASSEIIESGLKLGFIQREHLKVDVEHSYKPELSALIKYMADKHPEERSSIQQVLEQVQGQPQSDNR